MVNILKISEDHQNTELNVQILCVLQNWLSREQSTGPCRMKTSSRRVFQPCMGPKGRNVFILKSTKPSCPRFIFIKSTGCTKHCEGVNLGKQFWHMSLILLHSHRRHIIAIVIQNCIKHIYFFFDSGTSVLTPHPFEIKETTYSISHGTSAKANYKLIPTQ